MAVKDLVDAYRGWPKWARIAAPVVAGFLAIGAVGSASSDSSSTDSTTSTTSASEFGEIDEAIAIAFKGTKASGLTQAQTATLVRATCSAAEESDGADVLAGKIFDLDVEQANVSSLVDGLGDGAEVYCPTVVADAPELLNDTYRAWGVLSRAATTTTAAPTTTVAPTTTAAPTTTVALTTTAAPRTTTTRAPATTAPPPPTATTDDCRVGASRVVLRFGRCYGLQLHGCPDDLFHGELRGCSVRPAALEEDHLLSRRAAIGALTVAVAAACATEATYDPVAKPAREFAPVTMPLPEFSPVTEPPPSGGGPGTTASSSPNTSSPTTTAAPVTAGEPSSALTLVDQLIVAPESGGAGYDRDLFQHWVDADGDGCNTRCEVLDTERRTDLPGLASGWLSIYDGYTTDDPGELDVDHVVALGEAWRSGADTWDAARRRAFANDLDEPDALIAVTASTNRSKSDRDPAEWQPPNQAGWCQFALGWMRVKIKWGLTADESELRALRNIVADC